MMMAKHTESSDAADADKRRWKRDPGQFLFTAATNKPAPRVGDYGVRSLRSLVNRLGGKKQAAEELGVSVRTVQRWTAQKSESRAKPGAASKGRIREQQEQYRRQQLSKAATGRRAARMASGGAVLRVQGVGGVQRNGLDYSKRRPELSLELSGDETADLFQAMGSGDTGGAMDMVNQFFDDKYLTNSYGWEWTDVERLTLDDF